MPHRDTLYLLATVFLLLTTIDARAERLRRRQGAMADNATLAAALQALANAVASIQQNQQAQAAHAAQPVLDPFASDDPFDLASRAGDTAFKQASAAIEPGWDGTPTSFPPFLNALRIRAREARWDAVSPQGITAINDHDLLTNYHEITTADAETARANRVNDRAVQNAKAMYRAVKASLKNPLRGLIFNQFANTPQHEDGPSLFFLATSFSTTSTLQVSQDSFHKLIMLDPSDYEFNIPLVNTELSNLFVLATTPHRSLSENERIQHALTTYARIQQPQTWATWVATQQDNFDDNLITVGSQLFLNSAARKYNKIKEKKKGFHASSKSIQEEIVAMIAKQQTKGKHKSAPKTPSDEEDKKDEKRPASVASPPFAKHTHPDNKSDAVPYKVGDTKEWKGTTYHFCDTPNHRGKIHWHTHATADCRTRQRWLAKKQAEANLASEDIAQPPPSDDNSGESEDATALLTRVYAMLSTDPAAQGAVGDLLHSLNDENE